MFKTVKTIGWELCSKKSFFLAIFKKKDISPKCLIGHENVSPLWTCTFHLLSIPIASF